MKIEYIIGHEPSSEAKTPVERSSTATALMATPVRAMIIPQSSCVYLLWSGGVDVGCRSESERRPCAQRVRGGAVRKE